jgi:hypothetical protein
MWLLDPENKTALGIKNLEGFLPDSVSGLEEALEPFSERRVVAGGPDYLRWLVKRIVRYADSSGALVLHGDRPEDYRVESIFDYWL